MIVPECQTIAIGTRQYVAGDTIPDDIAKAAGIEIPVAKESASRTATKAQGPVEA